MNKKENLEFVATCLFGLEGFAAEEIEALGYRKNVVTDGRVSFFGDISAVARCNIWLRYAERLYIKLGEFDALSFDDLFEGTKNLPWEAWIGKNDMFPVKGHSIKSKLASIPDCQKIVKKAAATRLLSKHGVTVLDETRTKYQIAFFILNDRATLMIDASGDPLHKRGYRFQSAEAPLRETLAAAMVKISRPRGEVLLWDPFCGSGTIPIEAALLMTNTAPGQNRSFASEQFGGVPAAVWKEARDEAKSLQNLSVKFESYASDIDGDCVKIAKSNTDRAGMGKYVKTFAQDALTIETKGRRGTIVTNPPYGERMSTKKQTEKLYREMGRHFETLDRWQIYILSSHENFPLFYKKRPDKIRKLYNGMIKCGYFQYYKSPK
ncbi:MAG: class I SAM-dependent RNA methyltransferase [Oscillospiraceae bacterium]|nr:class I SAM-dependent RNA methyltransferase [Oscillospiraceae bacterium]